MHNITVYCDVVYCDVIVYYEVIIFNSVKKKNFSLLKNVIYKKHLKNVILKMLRRNKHFKENFF